MTIAAPPKRRRCALCKKPKESTDHRCSGNDLMAAFKPPSRCVVCAKKLTAGHRCSNRDEAWFNHTAGGTEPRASDADHF